MTEYFKKQSEILIVDDNPENLRVIGSILKNAGYKIRIAKNGKQALESIEMLEPDLLLLDVHMPIMDGFQTCKIIKKEWENERLPVIFLSALNDTFNLVQAFEAGACDYMTKPFVLVEVLERVKTHLRLRSLEVQVEHLKKELELKNKEIIEFKRD